jgi:uncharacterized membrane protein YdjX (TVP38/TMEM64 family)
MKVPHKRADQPPASSSGGSSRAAWWRPVALAVLVLSALLLAHFFGVGARLGGLREWISAQGSWAPVIFVLVYIGAVMAAVPGALLTLAGGALFGVAYGVILVSIASTAGAAVCFLIARYMARDAVMRWVGSNERFRRLDDMARRHGAVIVALTRLVPLFPFNVLNYGFGLTAIPFRTYLFWSWLCMLPATVLYVAGSDALFSGLQQGRVSSGLIAVIVAAAILLALLIPFAKRRLNSPSPSAGDAGKDRE